MRFPLHRPVVDRRHALLAALLSLAAPRGSAQMTGGVSSDSETPREVKAHELQAQVLTGDVDLFTGRYSAQHPLGQVAVPGGLSYELALQYSPTIVGSATPSLVEGVPYGAGWDVNVPSITVSNAYRHYYTEEEEREILAHIPDCYSPCTSFRTLDSTDATMDEGAGYWYAPMLNIPGVASGRAVFQRVDRSEAIFVLNTFERFVELRYDGTVWTVYTSDGKVFKFGPAEVNVRMPSNQRTMDYDRMNDYVGALDPDGTVPQLAQQHIRNSIMPKQVTYAWRCTSISDPLHLPGQFIRFEYEFFGDFDFYQELGQENYNLWLYNEFFSLGDDDTAYYNFATPLNSLARVSSPRDVVLQRVIATSTEGEMARLELDYAVKPGGTENMLNSGDSLDAMYGKEMVWGVGGETDMEDWVRFVHMKSGPALSSVPDQDLDPTDPYRNQAGEHYSVGLADASELAFDHGFLESPRFLDSGENLYPGDIYEVRTSVFNASNQPTDIGNLDISLFTGTADPVVGYTVGLGVPGTGIVNSADYGLDRKKEVFSTFDRAVKWNTNGVNANTLHTSNFFLMPDLSSGPSMTHHGTLVPGYSGLTLQIGPANSDNDFSLGPNDDDGCATLEDNLMWVDSNAVRHFSAYKTYIHQKWSRQYDGPSPEYVQGTKALGVLSHHPLPHSFGVGLPWSMLLLPAHHLANTSVYFGRPWENDMFSFWWNDGTCNTNFLYANKPTLFPSTVKLKRAELWRYSKRAYLLKEVRSYVRNGPIGDPASSGLRLVGRTVVEHQAKLRKLYRNLEYFPSDPLVPGRYDKNVLLLTAVRQAPVDPSHDPPADLSAITTADMPSTTFTYDTAYKYVRDVPTGYDCEGALATNSLAKWNILEYTWASSPLLSGIVDPLGRKTTIEYNDPTDPDLTETQTFNLKAELALDTADVCDSRMIIRDGSLTMSPTVKRILRSDATSDTARATDYAYADKVYKATRKSPNAHYRELRTEKEERAYGYLNVTVTGPQNGTHAGHPIRNRTEHHFHGAQLMQFDEVDLGEPYGVRRLFNSGLWPSDTSDLGREFLLFGKLKWSDQYDHDDRLLVHDASTYTVSKAFENGMLRPHWDISRFAGTHDYVDYDTAFIAVPLPQAVPEQLRHALRPYPDNAFLETAVFAFPSPSWSRYKFTYPDIYLNSYFVALSRTEHTEHDPDGCVNTEPLVVPPWPGDIDTLLNAGGSGYVNSTVDPNSAVRQSALASSGLNTTVKNDLVSSVSLDEAVLSKTIKVVQPADVERMREVLVHQPALTSERMVELFLKGDTVPTPALRAILEAQPYLSDGVLGLLFASGRSSKLVKDMLLRQEHLSSIVLRDLLDGESGLPGQDVLDVLSAQGRLPRPILARMMQDTVLSDRMKAAVLVHQERLPQMVFDSLEAGVDRWDPNAVLEIARYGKDPLTDEVLLAIIDASPAWDPAVVASIVEASRTAPDSLVRVAIDAHPEISTRLGKIDQWETLTTDCGAACRTEDLSISVYTDYAYYTADHAGITDALGYKRLFGHPSGHGAFQLKWQPSWLLFSKRTFSPQSPSAYTTDEYYYYQDLQNRYDRHWSELDSVDGFHVDIYYDDIDSITGLPFIEITSENDSDNTDFDVPAVEAIRRLDEFGHRTAEAYQHRLISKNAIDSVPLVTNEFRYFFGQWPQLPYPTNSDTLIAAGDPCPQDTIMTGSGGAGNSNGTGPAVAATYRTCSFTDANWADQLSEVPEDYALARRVDGGFYFVPATLSELIADTDSVWTVLFRPWDPDRGSGEREDIAELDLKRAFQLRSSHRQADSLLTEEYTRALVFGPEDVPLMQFARARHYTPEEEAGVLAPVMPYATLDEGIVLRRNAFQQPDLVQDERGLLTRYAYDRKHYAWFHNPTTPCHNYQTETLYHPGLPSAIISGSGRADSLVTYYRYKPDNSVDSIIDPNGMVLHYDHDMFGRMARSYRNGDLLAAQQYAYWSNTTAHESDDFATRAQAGHVTTVSYLDPDDDAALVTRAYADPLGRAYNTLAWAYDVPDPDAPGQVPAMVSSGRTEYDSWDRAVKRYKPYLVQQGGSPFELRATNTVLSGTPALYTTAHAETDPRGRPLTETKVGETVGSGGHWVQHAYKFLDEGAFACALGLSAAEAYQLMPSHLTAHVWRMAETTDEDGRRSRTYTNALGQQVATQAFIDDSTTAVTLFHYDSQGRLACVVDPEKHRTMYAYNLLGWPYRKDTPDGGSTKYMYDVSGNVVLEQDAANALGEPVCSETDTILLPTYRRYTYDIWNRSVRQERVRLASYDLGDVVTIGQVDYDLNTRPAGPLRYGNVFEGIELVGENEDEEFHDNAIPNDFVKYVFTSGSTLDWLAGEEVLLGASLLRKRIAATGLVRGAIPEKEWHYPDSTDEGFEHLVLTAGELVYLLHDRTNGKGRLTSTVTYPHRSYLDVGVFGNDHLWERPVRPHVQDLFSYDDAGRTSWQIQQFNPNGISPEAPGLLALLDHAHYDLQGHLRTMNIDINADHVLDLQQQYTYDAWGRLTDVHVSHDGSGTAGDHLAAWTYDKALGLLKNTRYYRYCEKGEVDMLCDSISYAYDDRDRPTGSKSRFYSEDLYYDGDLPECEGTPLEGQHNRNGLVNGTRHQYRYSAAPVPAVVPDVGGPSYYGYTYDGLGRLLHADAIIGEEVSGLPLDPDGLRFRIGDGSYTFSRSGDLLTLARYGRYGSGSPGAIQDQAWSYHYGAGTSRLHEVKAIGASVLSDRKYGYNATGDLITDAYRGLDSMVIGRGHLPWAFTQHLTPTKQSRSQYLYDQADRRIHKRAASGTRVLSQADINEWHLFDGLGREAGVLDLNKGTWAWYLFGAQRFARLAPDSVQQPAFYDGNLLGARFGQMQPNDEYERLVECLLELEADSGLVYPITLHRVLLPGEPPQVLFLAGAAYADLIGSGLPIDQDDEWVFTDAEEEVSVQQGEESVLVSIGMILGDEQYGGGTNANGLWYIYPEETELHRVTYYEHDHLGNLRVAYTPDLVCTEDSMPALDEGLSSYRMEQVLDYYPYGKVLRQWVNETGMQKYLTTQHERDQETGFDYRGARYYDSDVARFLSLDPLAADYANWSPYNYVMGNPISLIDPNGQGPEEGPGDPPTKPGILEQAVLNWIWAFGEIGKQHNLAWNRENYNPNPYSPDNVNAGLIDVSNAITSVAAILQEGSSSTYDNSYSQEKPANYVERLPGGGLKAGSAGGPGAGKRFSNAIRQEAIAETDGTCVFCGVKTGKDRGPLQTNVDHAIPKSRNGNNTLENAQTTCRTCNLAKGTQTTDEYLSSMGLSRSSDGTVVDSFGDRVLVNGNR